MPNYISLWEVDENITMGIFTDIWRNISLTFHLILCFLEHGFASSLGMGGEPAHNILENVVLWEFLFIDHIEHTELVLNARMNSFFRIKFLRSEYCWNAQLLFALLSIRPCVPYVFRVLDGPCFLLLFTLKYSIFKFLPFYLPPCLNHFTKMNKDQDKQDMFGLWRSMLLDECTVIPIFIWDIRFYFGC